MTWKKRIRLSMRLVGIRRRYWSRRVYEARIQKKMGYFPAEIARGMETLRRRQAVEEQKVRNSFP